MGNINIFQISSTNPVAMSENVCTDINIKMTFNLDVDSRTIVNGISVSKQGFPDAIRGSLSYDSTTKTVSFIPAIPLQPSTIYDVVVRSTIQNILGVACKAFNFSFTTTSALSLIPPVLSSPVNLSNINTVPLFSWYSTEIATEYEIQISLFDSFSVNSFSTILHHGVSTSEELIEISPSVVLDVGSIYYWRVRALKDVSSPANTIIGSWSEEYRFSIVAELEPILNPDDEIADYIDDYVEGKILLSTFPEEQFSNVGTNIKAIHAIIDGIVDLLEIDPRKMFIEGKHITEYENYIAYDPDETYTNFNNIHHGEVQGNWTIIIDEIKEKTYIIFQPKVL